MSAPTAPPLSGPGLEGPATSASDSPIELSIVMPCLNEALTVGTCVKKALGSLERLGVVGEVIIADNGSTDGSIGIAEGAGARVVPVSAKGYGSALQGGIAAARGRYVIMGDADDSYDFTNLGPFLERLRGGDDLVMGNRFKGGIKPGAMPWHHRYVGNPVLTGVLNLFYRTPIGDAHCGLRGFAKASYERLGLRTTGMEFASEMVVKASLSKQRVSEVPTTLSPDGRDRPPHLRSFRDGWRHLRFLLLLCPTWLYLVPSAFLMGTGGALMLWLTGGPREALGVTFDVHTMLMGALMVLLGHQVLWLWAFAKVFGQVSGVLPEATFRPEAFERFNLERGALAGIGLALLGLAVLVGLIVQWARADWGPLDAGSTLRPAFWGLVLVVLGFQTLFGSFFLSMLGMARRA